MVSNPALDPESAERSRQRKIVARGISGSLDKAHPTTSSRLCNLDYVAQFPPTTPFHATGSPTDSLVFTGQSLDRSIARNKYVADNCSRKVLCIAKLSCKQSCVPRARLGDGIAVIRERAK